ncbi:MAG: DinB family protein [Anaerolineales bacterium]|nr:DinB family protein [Anaerolineales bacterium]
MAVAETIVEIKTKLETERAKLLDALTNVPRDAMLRPFGDGGWSIKDVLAHVAMAETVNVQFAKMMVAKEAPLQLREFAAAYPDFPGEFELDKFNAWMTERWRVKSLEEILAALKDARVETLAWLDTLSLAQLERPGEHAVWGKQSVRGMLRILVIHDKFHRGDIEKRKK